MDLVKRNLRSLKKNIDIEKSYIKGQKENKKKRVVKGQISDNI